MAELFGMMFPQRNVMAIWPVVFVDSQCAVFGERALSTSCEDFSLSPVSL